VPNYVNKNNVFEQTSAHTRECPHCGAHAQLIPVSVPKFDDLVASRPSQVPLGFICSACREPRFGRAQVRAFEPERVELSGHIVEIERAKERFQFAYLPTPVRRLFGEALDCYSADLHNAFASMCRRVVLTASQESPDEDRLRKAFGDIIGLAAIDAETAARLETVLFDEDPAIPEISAEQSAVLIEVTKDVLYQCFVRTAKFRAAMNMRRYFAEESHPKVTSIARRARGRAPPMARNG
jgi:hypothetical protein